MIADAGQLGGDVVLDAAGRTVFAHPGRDPGDRPPVAALLTALATAAGAAEHARRPGKD